jgi:hypothetical protein
MIRNFDSADSFIKHIFERYNFETIKYNLCASDKMLINDSKIIISHIRSTEVLI